MRLTGRRIAVAAVALLLAGCSWQQAYYAGQAWQRNACNRLIEQTERERCVRNADMSYQEYQQRIDSAKKG